MSDRIAYAPFEKLVVSAEEAAKHVNNGDRVGISGFTGAGYPKAMPAAIAARIVQSLLIIACHPCRSCFRTLFPPA